MTTRPPSADRAVSRVRGGGVLDRDHAATTVGAIALVTLIAFENLAVTTAMPVVADALGGLVLYALAFGAPLATAIVGMVLSGRWSDLRGPAGPLTLGPVLFTAGLLIAAVAPSMGMVAAGRGIQGFGSGVIIVALYVLAARAYPAPLRPKVFAAFSAAWVVPALVGPTVSGLIVEHFGWRWVFAGVAMVVPIAAVLVKRGIGRTPDAQTAGEPGSAVLTSTLAWAGIAGASASLLHVAGHAGVAAAALLITAGLAGVAISAPRLLPAGTFRARPGLPAVIALRGIAGATFFSTEVFVPLLLVRERGLAPAVAGLALTVSALTWSVGSWLQGRSFLPDRRLRLRAGMLLIMAGIGVVALVALGAPVAVAIAGWAVGGLGMGLVYPTLSVLVLELSTVREQGSNSSSLQLADSLFTTLALALTGAVFAAVLAHSDRPAYLAGFAITAAIAVVGVLVAGRTLTSAGPDVTNMRADPGPE